MGLTKLGGIVGGRYRLDRIIAYGGTAAVYEAVHLVTRRRVAIKRPLPQFEHDREIHERLLREARALVRARHPNVVDVLDAGRSDDGAPYVALELLDGKTLRAILAARGPLGAAAATRIGIILCEALATAHQAGVVHCDVKPGNVFVARRAGLEVVKLFDFGAASMPGERPVGQSGEPPSIAGLLGTIEYVAPELLHDAADVDEQVDVYSLGVTLFECLTGTVPFEGHLAKVMHLVMTQSPPSVRERCPGLPTALAAAVDRALARGRLYRFRSVSELRRALIAALPEALPTTRPSVPPASTERHAALPPESVPPPSGAEPEPLVGDAPATHQRRRHPRVPYVMPVAVRLADGSVHEGRSDDISESGLRALLYSCPRDASEVTLRFALPGTGELVEIGAATRWCRAGRAVNAVGLEFTEPSDEVRTSIREFVRAYQTVTTAAWANR